MASNPESRGLPLVLLHGLLGDGHDWQDVIDALPGIECHALDLPGYGRNQHLRVDGFDEANAWLSGELETRGIRHYRLAGYSLGGRLALYHASHSPAGLQALLLENCHPGLPSGERAARLRHDEEWASRFEHEPLAEVLADWYRQPVFADLDEDGRARQLARRLGNDGRAVAAMLRATSLGKQPELAPWLASTGLPLTWISGNRDQKFHRLACQLVEQGCNINHLALDGGHNLHADQPERFAACLRDWLGST
ncbi:2-succinyl-6-hydroxy-2,4-cyclohexadiene-1-carboxylate synthase [Aeromonas sp. NJAU223]|uniref:2-succinyl-6-hydroxy-2, 4-cyclohexadiene-1-carboxylate synthase n=1 Tax=Aeromonas sp. NJAU223 TaxID=3115650 RepID=UPI003DAA2226